MRDLAVALFDTTRGRPVCLGAVVAHVFIPLYEREISRLADAGWRRDTVGIQVWFWDARVFFLLGILWMNPLDVFPAPSHPSQHTTRLPHSFPTGAI